MHRNVCQESGYQMALLTDTHSEAATICMAALRPGAAAGMQKEQGASTRSVQDVCWATSACRSQYCTIVDRYIHDGRRLSCTRARYAKMKRNQGDTHASAYGLSTPCLKHECYL